MAFPNNLIGNCGPVAAAALLRYYRQRRNVDLIDSSHLHSHMDALWFAEFEKYYPNNNISGTFAWDEFDKINSYLGSKKNNLGYKVKYGLIGLPFVEDIIDNGDPLVIYGYWSGVGNHAMICFGYEKAAGTDTAYKVHNGWHPDGLGYSGCPNYGNGSTCGGGDRSDLWINNFVFGTHLWLETGNHTSHTFTQEKFTKGDYKFYKCTGCDYMQKRHNTNHTYGAWQKNTTHHWKDCTADDCYEKSDYTTHTMINGTCTFKYCNCSYYEGSNTHGSYTYTNNGNGTHTQKCGNCQAPINSTLSHTTVNGTCTYKSCSASGCNYSTGTSLHGNYTYTNNGTSGHTQKCGNCQATSAVSHSLTNGTCTYKSCVCGYSTGTSSHSYTYTNNGTSGHTQKCGNCQATSTVAHTLTNGTCTYKSCVCGYSTGASSHGNYTYTNNGSSGHTQKCGNCQATSTSSHNTTTVSLGSSGHAPQCGSCGYQGTTISHTLVAGICVYKYCNGCSYSLNSPNHSYGWTWNSTTHWQYCNSCGSSINSGAHSWTAGTCTYKKCNPCGCSTGSSSHGSYYYVSNYNGTHNQKCGNCSVTTATSIPHTPGANGKCTYNCGS